jgi:hypothetical protein
MNPAAFMSGKIKPGQCGDSLARIPDGARYVTRGLLAPV